MMDCVNMVDKVLMKRTISSHFLKKTKLELCKLLYLIEHWDIIVVIRGGMFYTTDFPLSSQPTHPHHGRMCWYF